LKRISERAIKDLNKASLDQRLSVDSMYCTAGFKETYSLHQLINLAKNNFQDK
jgi:hypothetical protein